MLTRTLVIFIHLLLCRYAVEALSGCVQHCYLNGKERGAKPLLAMVASRGATLVVEQAMDLLTQVMFYAVCAVVVSYQCMFGDCRSSAALFRIRGCRWDTFPF